MSLQNILANLQYFDRTLPNVPPEEEHYLTKEYDAVTSDEDWKADRATQAVLARRLEQLQSRPLFYVWRVRTGLRKVIIEVKAVKDPAVEFNAFTKGDFKGVYSAYSIYTNEAANRLNRAIEASSDLSDLDTRITELVDHEEARGQQSLLSPQQMSGLISRGALLVFDMNEYAGCQLAKLAPTKEFPPFTP
jgi:hypothetical protein